MNIYRKLIKIKNEEISYNYEYVCAYGAWFFFSKKIL